MFVQARLIGRASGFSEYDEYVPMVDKAVDLGWKEKQVATQNSYGSTGQRLDAYSLKLLILICPIVNLLSYYLSLLGWRETWPYSLQIQNIYVST